MESEKRFYVYVHRRKTDDKIFYVGKGRSYRYKETYGRNCYWHRVADKHGWYACKVKENMSEPCSLTLEKIIILLLRKSGEKLTNATDGGEGVSGLKHTEETKRKMVANRKKPHTSPWAGKTIPLYAREKMRNAKLGKKQSPEHAEKSRVAKIGKPQPLSARQFTSRIKSKPIIRSDGLEFTSVKKAVEFMKIETGLPISQGNISGCANGDRNIAYGYKWRYK